MVSAYWVMCSLLEHSVMAVLSSLQQDNSLVSCYCLFKGTVSAYRGMCSLLEHSVMAVLSSLQQDNSLVSCYCLFKGTVLEYRVMCIAGHRHLVN